MTPDHITLDLIVHQTAGHSVFASRGGDIEAGRWVRFVPLEGRLHASKVTHIAGELHAITMPAALAAERGLA